MNGEKLEEMRRQFEGEHPSRLLFKRGGSVFAENIATDRYVDGGIQKQWELWQRAWLAGLATHQTVALPDTARDAARYRQLRTMFALNQLGRELHRILGDARATVQEVDNAVDAAMSTKS